MMKPRILIVCSIAAGMIIAGQDANAQPGWGLGRTGGGCSCLFGPQMAAALELTSDQQDQVDELYEDLCQDLEPLWQALDRKRVRLDRLLVTDPPDPGAIEALQAELDVLYRKIWERQDDYRADVLELLTPRQRARYQQLVQSGWGGRGRGRGGGWGYGRGRGRGWGRGWRYRR
jgi:Spy/CpxP family protein refolding chaperone